jgi:hypothetical protein
VSLLAAFDYRDLPEALVVGLLAAFILAILLGLSRRFLLGIVGGGAGGAVIAFLVAEYGGGDMPGLMGMSPPVTAGLLGAVIGGAAALVGKRLSPDDPI